MEYVLETKAVSKKFAHKWAVDHVSLGVKSGDIYGFIGENGAGKTTLMRMVCGLAAPTGGEIVLSGSLGCTIENPALYPAMTAFENMEVQRLLLGIADKKVSSRLLEVVGLADTGSKKAKDFSLGMKQRLMIALALLGDPELLVLDEPTNGLDPVGIKEVRDLLQRLNENSGISILVSSHILGELEQIATRYGVISKGKMVDEFRADELNLRCGKNLLIYTDDTAQAAALISRMLPNASIRQVSDTAVRMSGHVEEAGNINTMLVKAGLVVSALIPEGEKLEDYFMKLMKNTGGSVHA